MIEIQFSLRMFFIIVKTKAMRSITFMYVGVTRQAVETTTFVSQVFTFVILYQKICSDSVYELKNVLKEWCGCKCYLYVV